MAKLTAADIMKLEVVTIGTESTLEEAARKMLEKHVKCLVVEIGGWPEGLLTREDIIDRVVTHGGELLRILVKDAMSDPGIIISPELDARIVKKFMIQAKKEHSVVVDNGKLVGFISFSDLLRHGFL